MSNEEFMETVHALCHVYKDDVEEEYGGLPMDVDGNPNDYVKYFDVSTQANTSPQSPRNPMHSLSSSSSGEKEPPPSTEEPLPLSPRERWKIWQPFDKKKEQCRYVEYFLKKHTIMCRFENHEGLCLNTQAEELRTRGNTFRILPDRMMERYKVPDLDTLWKSGQKETFVAVIVLLHLYFAYVPPLLHVSPKIFRTDCCWFISFCYTRQTMASVAPSNDDDAQGHTALARGRPRIVLTFES